MPFEWSNAFIAASKENRRSLQSELEILITLPLLIRVRVVFLLEIVRNRYDICRLVHSALQLTLVAACVRIWIFRVEFAIVAAFTVSTVLTVRAIDCVQKGVEEADLVRCKAGGPVSIVGLKDGHVLWVYDR